MGCSKPRLRSPGRSLGDLPGSCGPQVLPHLGIWNILGAWRDPEADPNHPFFSPEQPGFCRTQTRPSTRHTPGLLSEGEQSAPVLSNQQGLRSGRSPALRGWPHWLVRHVPGSGRGSGKALQDPRTPAPCLPPSPQRQPTWAKDRAPHSPRPPWTMHPQPQVPQPAGTRPSVKAAICHPS